MPTHNAKRAAPPLGIMSAHASHLTYLMVSEVTLTKSNEYQ